MKIFADKKECYGCTACKHACPANCISMNPDEKGFYYPESDSAACNNCGVCVKICPFNKDGKKTSVHAPSVYAVKHKDDKIRATSSSGGAFSAISDCILLNGGVVYGASFDADLKVCHVRCETPSERDSLKGSKYVQSFLGDVFLSVKNDLSRGIKVLFSGTPCQVAGLYAYMGRGNENLFTCDFVCHGVPSPKLFADHVKALAKNSKSAITGIEFRNKINGWGKFVFAIAYGAEKKISPFSEDPYCYIFLNNLSLRPACHNCQYATVGRESDITIGDFWGIEKSNPTFCDSKGVSLVLLNTQAGRDLFSKIGGDLYSEESSVMAAMQHNLAYPTPESPLAPGFWADYVSMGYGYVSAKYTLQNPINRMRDFLYRVVVNTRVYPCLKRLKEFCLNKCRKFQ